VDISLIILLIFSILYFLNLAFYLLNCIFSFLTSVYNLLLDWIGGRSMYSSSRAYQQFFVVVDNTALNCASVMQEFVERTAWTALCA